jgi:hexokinase
MLSGYPSLAALINDTVGTLLAHAYSNPGTYIGAIFGTGTNGAYVEATENIKSVDVATKATRMIVNTEWGNFSKCKRDLPVTIFDNKLDRESIVCALSDMTHYMGTLSIV